MQRFRETGLTVGLTQACENGIPRDLTKALTVASGDDSPAYVGRDRARDLAVNVVLPFLHALNLHAPKLHTPGYPADAGPFPEIYWEVYRAFGKLQENDLTKEMSRRLLGAAWHDVADSARRQQGLIQLQRLLAGAS